MSDTVWVVLIVAAAVVVILYMYRGQLKDFFIKASQGGVEGGLSTHSPNGTSASQNASAASPADPGVDVSDNLLAGAQHAIQVRKMGLWERIRVSGNKMLGRGSRISVEVGDTPKVGEGDDSGDEPDEQ